MSKSYIAKSPVEISTFIGAASVRSGKINSTCETNPEMDGCQELPNTGPIEIIMAIIIIFGICCGIFYLYRTRKTLKIVQETVSGKRINPASQRKNR